MVYRLSMKSRFACPSGTPTPQGEYVFTEIHQKEDLSCKSPPVNTVGHMQDVCNAMNILYKCNSTHVNKYQCQIGCAECKVASSEKLGCQVDGNRQPKNLRCGALSDLKQSYVFFMGSQPNCERQLNVFITPNTCIQENGGSKKEYCDPIRREFVSGFWRSNGDCVGGSSNERRYPFNSCHKIADEQYMSFGDCE